MTDAQIQAAAEAIDRMMPIPPAVNPGPAFLFEDGSLVRLISFEAAEEALKAVEAAEER